MESERRQPYGALPREFAGGAMSIAQLWNILWARKVMIIAITFLMAALAVVMVKLMPKIYTSRATLVVSPRVDDPMSGSETQISFGYLATQVEFIQSPVILMPVVDKFHLAEREEYMAGYDGDGSPESRSQWAMAQLSRNLNVWQGAGSLFIYVHVNDQIPQASADIANAIVDAYVADQQKRFLEPARERASRYSEQLQSLRAKVDEAQARIAAFRQKTGLMELNPDSIEGGGPMAARIEDLESRLADAAAKRLEADLRLRRIREGDANILNSLAVQNLRAKIQASEARLAELGSTLGARHPEIVSLKSDIDHARAQLNAELGSHIDSARAEVASAVAIENGIKRQLREAKGEILVARTQQDEASQLLRELDSASKIYQGALDAFETVRLGTEISAINVQVVSRATPPLKPNSSRGRKLLALAVIAGGGGSAILAIILELLNRRIRSREDMERDLGLPVLIQLQGRA